MLTAEGRSARSAFAQTVSGLPRGDGAREALDTARASWATFHVVEPADATVLAEFGDAPMLHRQVLAALGEVGLNLADVQDAVDRLYAAGLLAPADGLPPEVRGQA